MEKKNDSNSDEGIAFEKECIRSLLERNCSKRVSQDLQKCVSLFGNRNDKKLMFAIDALLSFSLSDCGHYSPENPEIFFEQLLSASNASSDSSNFAEILRIKCVLLRTMKKYGIPINRMTANKLSLELALLEEDSEISRELLLLINNWYSDQERFISKLNQLVLVNPYFAELLINKLNEFSSNLPKNQQFKNRNFNFIISNCLTDALDLDFRTLFSILNIFPDDELKDDNFSSFKNVLKQVQSKGSGSDELFGRFYASIVGRPTYKLANKLTEIHWNTEKEVDDNMFLFIEKVSKNFKIENCFLATVLEKKHFLCEIVAVDMNKFRVLPDRLKIIYLLDKLYYSYTVRFDATEYQYIIDKLQEIVWNGDEALTHSDVVLEMLINNLKWIFEFIEWCTNKFSSPENLRLSLFQSFTVCESPLNVLHKHGILNLLTSQDVEVLNTINELLAGHSNKNEVMLWNGYMAIKLCMNCILNFTSIENNESFEETLNQVKSFLRKLLPITFRVEVLENLFGLLFVTAKDIVDEKENDPDEDGYVEDSYTNTGKNTSDVGEHLLVESKPTTTASSASYVATSSFFSSIDPVNFLFPSELVPQYLSLLNEEVEETQTLLFTFQRKTAEQREDTLDEVPQQLNIKSSVTNYHDCKSRLQSLKDNIIEALWRYDVIEPTIVKQVVHPKKEVRNNVEILISDSEDIEQRGSLENADCALSEEFKNSINQKEVFSSVIPCMLASPKQLLRYCIIEDKIDKAKQVYQLFEESLRNTEEAFELFVIKKCHELSTKLKLFTTKKTSSAVTSRIAETAAKGLQKSEIQAILHEFYLCVNTETGNKVDSNRLSLDFAITSCPSLVLSQIILETTSRTSKVGNGRLGFEKLESLFNQLSSMISLFLEQNSFKNIELPSILSYSFDENLFVMPHVCSDVIEKMNSLKLCIMHLRTIIFEDNREASRSIPDHRKLIVEYQKLLRLCPTNKHSYLRALFFHVRKVSKALTECRKRSESFKKEFTELDQEFCSSKHANGTFFSVLYKSPAVTLCSMILKLGISPKVVDDLAKDMKVDLLETLCSLFSPFIPAVPKDDLDFELVDSFHPALCELIQCYLTGSQSNNESVCIQNYFDDETETSSQENKYVEKIKNNNELIEYFRSKSWILIEILNILKLLKLGSIRRNRDEGLMKEGSPLQTWISLISSMFQYEAKEDPVLIRSLALHPKIPASHNYVMKILEKLAQNKDLVKIYDLLRFIDMKNPSSSLMALKTAILLKLTQETQNVKFALQINDVKTKSALIYNTVLKSDSYSDTNTAIRALKSALSVIEESPDFQQTFITTSSELKLLMKKVLCYAKIAELAGLRSWKDALNNLSDIDILTILKTRKAYSVALDWNELNLNSEKLDIETETMKSELLLLAYCEKKQMNLLEDVLQHSSDPVALAEKILPQVDDWNSKSFLVSFISKNFAKLSPEKHEFYSNYMLGIKLINFLPPANQSQYIALCAKPELIVEQMLMNMEFEALEKSLKIHKLIKCDELIEKYAKKAVDIEVVDNLSFVGSDTTMVSSTILCEQSAFVMPSKIPTIDQWIPDNKVSFCMLCKLEKFSMFNRRHHCRRCGRVICGTCSRNVLVIPEVTPFAAVRVCDDCYTQTRARSPRKESTTSFASSIKTFRWILAQCEDQNEALREEFYYESAPSSSLCLSILKLHSDGKKCSDVIIEKFCKPLFDILSSNQVDYGLVINTIKSLLISAKVLVSDDDSYFIDKINFLLARIDIVKMLVNENCIDRSLISCVVNDENAFLKLQEKLIEMERFELALNIAMKFGINLKPIWKTWAVVCLKNRMFTEARAKYKHCFVPKASGEASSINGKLLEEIFDILEKLKSSDGPSLRERCKAIKNGQNLVKDKALTPNLPPSLMNEAFYYLDCYGSKEDFVKFYLRFDMIRNAVETFISESHQSSLNTIFISALLIPCLNKGTLEKTLNSIHALDPTLSKIWRYLYFACKFLSQNNYYNTLYTLQLFMGDYIRAAITQINYFYLNPPATDYNQLYRRKEHLILAKQHCRDYLANMDHLHKGCYYMSANDVKNQIRTIDFQIEISTKFHEKGIKGFLEFGETSSKNSPLPTLLDHNKARKTLLAALVAVEGGSTVAEAFTLAQQIIKDHCLDGAQVYRFAGRTIMQNHNINVLSQFLSCIRASLPPEESSLLCDDVIGSCIRNCTNNELMEPLIKLLISDINKIDAYIFCNKLKSAYLLAVRLERITDVRRIHSLAVRTNQERIKQICEAFLNKYDKN
ncbi:Zinc finger FYVE domain-containing protein-like protein [Dinothrombium tinctorium]|uniref:Zinc finger FYVE domain-containing protein-like protein n=1 Tax=Dinothrombium tinctorium TaxID=1965070 RepID=A0A3S3PK36_9ACAR|nr:Zinc finger FYVE domain-containing protein-like protein [Dinothrombium tinctorium]